MRIDNLTYNGYPTTYDASLSSANGTSASYPPQNGCSNASSTSYANFTSSKQEERHFYYNFNVTGISEYADISSIDCSVKTRVGGTSANYLGYIQLFVGTTAKGTETIINTTTVSTPVQLDLGTNWQLSDFDNLNIRITPNRNANNRYIRFYGANLVINYSITYYSITTSSTSQTATITSSSSEIEKGNSVVITATTTSLSKVIIKKDGTDITNQFVGSGSTYTYNYSNVNADTSFTIEDVPQIESVLYLKISNQWHEIPKVYKKTNNSWVEQTDLDNVFADGNVYVNSQN